MGLRALLWLPPVQARAREAVERQLEARLGEAHLEGSLRGGLGLSVRLGPLRLGKGDWLTVEEVTVTPSLRALLRGRMEPAAVHLERARVALDDVVLPERKGPRPGVGEGSALPALSFDGLKLVQRRSPLLAPELGPFEGSLRVAGAQVRVRLALPDGGELRVQVERDGARGTVQAQAQRLQLRSARWLATTAAAEREPASLLAGLDASAQLSGTFSGEYDRAQRTARGQLSLSVEQASLTQSRLSRAPLTGLTGGLEASLAVTPVELSLPSATVWLGAPEQAVRVQLAGALGLTSEKKVRLTAQVLPVTYAALAAALPGELGPPPGAPQFAGTVGLRARWEGPLRQPDDWTLEVKLELDDARRQSRAQGTLAGEVRYAAVSSDGRSWPVVVGPKNPRYVPLAELPPQVAKAVMTSEDAGFMAHPGFDFMELRSSIVDALMHRRVRGASTLSQQLAKNLFVSSEHTLARKVREAVVTVSLEAAVPKERLLEVYLNAVEWGPGLYGVGAAAQHYFAKDARELTPKEAAFLATILPNPVRYHGYHLRGLSELWEQRLSELLAKMAEEGALTPEEYEAAQGEPLHFNPSCGGSGQPG